MTADRAEQIAQDTVLDTVGTLRGDPRFAAVQPAELRYLLRPVEGRLVAAVNDVIFETRRDAFREASEKFDDLHRTAARRIKVAA